MRGQWSAPLRIEMSMDNGNKWEQVQLPVNSLPFHQCVNIGRYQEQHGDTLVLYRRQDA